MLLSHSTWGMPHVPIDTAVQHCASLGFDGLQLTIIPGWITSRVTSTRHSGGGYGGLYDDHNLELCGFSGNTRLAVEDADELRTNLDRFRCYIDLAHEMQQPGDHLAVSCTTGGKPGQWERVKDQLVVPHSNVKRRKARLWVPSLPPAAEALTPAWAPTQDRSGGPPEPSGPSP